MFYFTSIFFSAAKGTIYFVSCSHGNGDLSRMERQHVIFMCDNIMFLRES